MRPCDDEILARVRACHGAVRLRDLRLDRTEYRHAQRLIERRLLFSHQGVVSLPEAGWDLILARIHGGVITCLHAAKHYGYPRPRLWAPVHLAVLHSTGRAPVRGEVLHVERSLELPPLTQFPVAPVPLMLARYLRCDPRREGPLMACDAALHQGHTGTDAIAALLHGPGSRQARQRLALASPRARSPLETLARLQLYDAGIPFADGVDIPRVGEVDLLVDDWLVLGWTVTPTTRTSSNLPATAIAIESWSGRATGSLASRAKMWNLVAWEPRSTNSLPRAIAQPKLSQIGTNAP
ncbi:hypothetical protein SAMN05216355_1178 [Actinomyces ruminicola]|uniref:Transcriptional regulator, AbiEi antitoxin, Type IV TA system n=1 Tax=Actinomyces ruminicola TaxID=332524 RepID=A0A1H0ELS4_9ACTO|nr:hypothetical protein SAMN05216355_1178 [Actinomyces ruminicola]